MYKSVTEVFFVTKELKIVGGASLLLIIVLIGVCFAMEGAPAPEQPTYLLPVDNDVAQPAVQPRVAADPEPVYVLRATGGGVAVYLSGSDEPLISLDVPAGKLRAADAEMLSVGIEVEGEEALWRLIEDFSS